MFKGSADRSTTASFLNDKKVHSKQIREFCDVPVSALALGTYLGKQDEWTDAQVTAACQQAFDLGCNFFDAAINYRNQRAERSIGEFIRRGILAGKLSREQIFVSTKGGFIPQDLIDTVKKSDLVAGCHCMDPEFLMGQLDHSRKNLGLETIDLYYLHNPETQLEELPGRIFYEKLERAFSTLEKAVADKKIAAYGMATWNAFRDEPGSQLSVELERCVALAVRAADGQGFKKHHFRAVQLPFNLAMPEAGFLKTQKVNGQPLTAIEAANALGLSVAVSVPLFQARLCHGMPEFVVDRFPKEFSQAHCALAFAAGYAGVDCAMVGMKQPEHVSHNLECLHKEMPSSAQIAELIEAVAKTQGP